MKDRSSHLIAVLGSGGVGKTTCAASVAFSLAEKGYAVSVITVDPAHRLAQIMGIESLSNEPKTVQKFSSGGTLDALWLNADSALEELVKTHVLDPMRAQRILNHRLFKILKSQLAGIEEYVGVEKVLQLKQSKKYDFCILDTPPSRHALDFFESPRHLVRFLDESILRFFIEDAEPQKRGLFSKLLKTGADQVLDVFRNFLGKVFLKELGELLENLKPLYETLKSTANEMETWLRSEQSSFFSVSLLEHYPLFEARLLSLELSAHEFRAAELLILNKCFPKELIEDHSWEDKIHPESAQYLNHALKDQNSLRLQIAKLFEPQIPTCELEHYSVKRLSQEKLLEIGKAILQSWKNPALSKT